MFTQIKQQTLTLDNLTKTSDNVYRYVNHELKLATTGFMNKEGLLKNTDIIRFDTGTIKLMESQYKNLFS
jgi:hypothetical protein